MRSEVEDIRLRRCLGDLRDAHASLRRRDVTVARILIVASIERLERILASVGRNPKGEDRADGLRAEHEHAVGEAETPMSEFDGTTFETRAERAARIAAQGIAAETPNLNPSTREARAAEKAAGNKS